MRTSKLLLTTAVAAFVTLSAPLSRAESISRYKVEESGTYLGKISFLLYGSSKKWRQLADANHLVAPYHIRLGQWLNLPEPVEFSFDIAQARAERFKQVQAEFRQRRNHLLAENQVAKNRATPKPVAAIAPVQAPVQAKEPAREPAAEKIEVAFEKPKTPEQVASKVLSHAERDSASTSQVQALLSAGKYNETQLVFDQEIQRNPQSADTWNMKGELYVESKEFGKAARAFGAARRVDSKNLVAWFGQIRALDLDGKKAEARSIAQALVRQSPQLKNLPYLKTFTQRSVASIPRE